MIKITATPARVVEDILLSIAGNRIHLHTGDWQRQLVDSYESHLSFDIPSFIEPASHKVHLIMEGEGGVEVKSPVFRVPLLAVIHSTAREVVIHNGVITRVPVIPESVQFKFKFTKIPYFLPT